jgi:Holliday junction resolvase
MSAAMKVTKYGLTWNPVKDLNGKLVPIPNWAIERNMLVRYEQFQKENPTLVMLPWAEHFCRLVRCIFGDPKGIYYFEWNPNAIRVMKHLKSKKILSLAGHKSSGKTDIISMIGVMMFWLDPENTKVIVTSTTVSAAQQKVWGKIKLIWQHLCKFFGGEENLPGKLMDSKNTIRYEDKGVKHDLRGLTLVAGDKGSAKESADKIQGTKAPVFVVVGDEFDTLEHSLVNTIFGNLSANAELYLLAAFNPTSYYSPGGVISKPVNGWHTVDENSTEWETEIEPFGIRGYCLRYDGEKSPNVLIGYEKYRGLLTLENINQFGGLGSKTPIYYSQIRGWWSATGNVDSIYSEVEIIKWRADGKVKTWIDTPKMVAGLDPAFTHGGDRAVLTIGKVGLAQMDDTTVQKVFEIVKFYILDLDMTNTATSKSEWVVKLTKKHLDEHGVDVRDLAFDGTGGGEPFGALIARDLGNGALNVNFSSKASDKPVSKSDPRPGNKRFRNMVSELWYVGKEFIRSGQLKGLQPDIVTEMVARTYEEIAGMVKVESKDDMKLRTKKSPDIADSAFLCLHMARMKHGLSSTETSAKRVVISKNRLFPTIDLNARAPREAVTVLGEGGGWGYGLR